MYKFKVLFLVFVVFADKHAKMILSENVSCRNENGEQVDWFYLYKLPIKYSTNITDHHSGLQYLYISSDSVEKGWQLSSVLINETDSFPGQTLLPIFNSLSALLIAYNDENPNGQVNFVDGHTKGVIAADDTSGFWLIHSVPKYPSIPDYDYPATGHHYGQSFLCISLPANQIELVGKQLIFNEPNIYYTKIPQRLASTFPTLMKATNKEWRKSSPFWNQVDLTSIKGTVFKSFAKGSKFNKELYEDWVAPTLNVDLFIETWRHGPGNLQSNCTTMNHVFNVEEVKIQKLNMSFNSTLDHSKWGVATENNQDWICVGDINRAEHQLVRGGGTVCQFNSNLSTLYRNIIANYEACPITNSISKTNLD